MGRKLVAAVSGLLGFGAATVPAQADRDIALVVHGPSECFEVETLRQRVAHFAGARLARAGELKLELDVEATDSAELRVYRGDALVSRREFRDLPDVCPDRRDAVALSIAMALDGAIHALPPLPDGGDSGARTQSATTEPVAAAESASEQAGGAREDVDSDSGASSNLPSVVRAGPSIARFHLGGRWLAHALPSPVWTGCGAFDSGEFAAQGCVGAAVAACSAAGFRGRAPRCCGLHPRRASRCAGRATHGCPCARSSRRTSTWCARGSASMHPPTRSTRSGSADPWGST